MPLEILQSWKANLNNSAKHTRHTLTGKPSRKLELIQVAEKTGKVTFICRTRLPMSKKHNTQRRAKGKGRSWQSSLEMCDPRMKVLQNKEKAST